MRPDPAKSVVLAAVVVVAVTAAAAVAGAVVAAATVAAAVAGVVAAAVTAAAVAATVVAAAAVTKSFFCLSPRCESAFSSARVSVVGTLYRGFFSSNRMRLYTPSGLVFLVRIITLNSY